MAQPVLTGWHIVFHRDDTKRHYEALETMGFRGRCSEEGYLFDIMVEREGLGVVSEAGEDVQDLLLLAGGKKLLTPVVAIIGAARFEIPYQFTAKAYAVACQDIAEEGVEAPGGADDALRAEIGAAAFGVHRLREDAGSGGRLVGGTLPDGVVHALGGAGAAVEEAPGVKPRHFRIFQCQSIDFHAILSLLFVNQVQDVVEDGVGDVLWRGGGASAGEEEAGIVEGSEVEGVGCYLNIGDDATGFVDGEGHLYPTPVELG